MHQTFATRPARGVEQRAGNGTRTRDPNLGKVVLYQLSYSRENPVTGNTPETGSVPQPKKRPGNGGEGNRTPDLLNAIQALSQLSYAPGNTAPTRRHHNFQELASLAGGMSSVKAPQNEIVARFPATGQYLAAVLRIRVPDAISSGALPVPMTVSGWRTERARAFATACSSLSRPAFDRHRPLVSTPARICRNVGAVGRVSTRSAFPWFCREKPDRFTQQQLQHRAGQKNASPLSDIIRDRSAPAPLTPIDRFFTCSLLEAFAR